MVEKKNLIKSYEISLCYRKVVGELSDLFRDAAGNFYINDKSTGSVVGQQPFGGTRLSGLYIYPDSGHCPAAHDVYTVNS